MKRYGPLIAVPEALAIGDPGRHHLRLTPDAVILREGIENRGIVAWEGLQAIALDVPTTRFRLPGLVGTILLGALTALTLTDLGIDPDDGAVEVRAHGESTRSPLSRHHVGGYWEPTVTGAQRLIQYLIENPEQRSLLARPEALIDVAARLATQEERSLDG
ncbi:hypothetical protein [Microbacterium sp. LWH12-1.2]|uniref:hypothetical protein n=1 Tax=Microbacterium sp. LWH12-1.2 TaxID=3135259 RepID=UPI003421313E